MVKSPSKPGGSGGGRSAHLSDYAAGAIIVQEGATGSEMFIIDDGEVEIVRLRGDSERILTTLGPGAARTRTRTQAGVAALAAA